MDEFRKPFEYDDEKRGLLMLFIIMITVVDGSIAIALTLQVYRILSHLPAVSIAFLVIAVSFFLFMLFTAVNCYRLKRTTAKVSKIYLIIRALFTVFSIVMVYINNVGNESLIGNGPRQFQSIEELTNVCLVYPLAYTLLFSGIWYFYFLRSKRFEKAAEEQAS